MSTLQRLVAKFEKIGSVNNQPTPRRQRNSRSIENVTAVLVTQRVKSQKKVMFWQETYLPAEVKKSHAEEWRNYLSTNGLCIRPQVSEDVELPEPPPPPPPTSPPFVRAPIEDRSKYEKLTFNVDDISSDDSDENLQSK
ncbi:hypothetical protein J6590_047221 [Homalodisca vitripennis]|nr:hypothetical protein J6590_047221 [Homalodisca vitripennis]